MAKMKTFRELMSRLPPDGHTRHALRRFNLGLIGPDSPPSAADLARTLGFDVQLVRMPRGQRGRLELDTFADSGYRIEVNADDDVRTRRWTVLHELMHALLHRRDDPFAFAQYRAGKEHFYLADELREEREANAFVEALVFGENALSASMSLYGGDREAVARHFGVSQITLDNALKKT